MHQKQNRKIDCKIIKPKAKDPPCNYIVDQSTTASRLSTVLQLLTIADSVIINLNISTIAGDVEKAFDSI